MSRPNNIFLIGPMGAGKSTIGRHLAQMLRMEFVDSDQELEDRTGVGIDWIYDVEGEDGLRAREQDVIADLSLRSGIVLATGGGAINSAENRKCLAGRGTVVYLYASVEQQLNRTAYDRGRPSLHYAKNRRELLEQMMAEYDKLYRSIADCTVATDARTVRSVANEIIQALATEA
ncbi:Shikimate kinase 1 [Piscirickettsia salmonis]|uniref:Shikimate kinase n=1 Tax=Piscirickettsia salmonis TaxID=1238 RepID=A0A1L6TFF3_PISSA|nr:shikimate kinase AroK [Piscirickettsia salmonis]AKP72348.2 shikimate kinase [Piscirickettsia salmonis LF-89 = ATCC VR-1361]ALB24199.1 shikimate kinase [Piscirickettsia salmonis]ALY03999.1 shikimate kinase [Piscirickettsia salmonis]AMA43563.1 shikimate kinase [Piscirickettsia salmonis]AOS36032.1 shikimate kinase [Piscirickettsia salmonis]